MCSYSDISILNISQKIFALDGSNLGNILIWGTLTSKKGFLNETPKRRQTYWSQFANVKGNVFNIENIAGKKALISFYRFAQCPFCNLRIHELTKRYDELENKLEIIAIFDSPLDHLIKSTKKHKAPFEILADENFKYFDAYGVEKSLFKFFIGSVVNVHRLIKASLLGFVPLQFKGSMLTVPVDILIDETCNIEQVYYGRNTTDHMSLDEIFDFAKK